MFDNCPICDAPTARKDIPSTNGFERYVCKRCGQYEIHEEAREDHPSKKYSDYAKALASHKLRLRQKSGYIPKIREDDIEELFSGLFPDIKEKSDSFILYIGEQSKGRGGFDCIFDPIELSAIIGAYNESELKFIIKSLDDRKLIERFSTTDFSKARLSFEGWDRFHELKQLKVDSRRAFMAMPFGKADVNTAYRDCFQPAVKQTGFRLERTQ